VLKKSICGYLWRFSGGDLWHADCSGQVKFQNHELGDEYLFKGSQNMTDFKLNSNKFFYFIRQ